jgi:hypothetical protein
MIAIAMTDPPALPGLTRRDGSRGGGERFKWRARGGWAVKESNLQPWD